MPQVVDDVASLVERLNQRIADLEARVSALENPQSTVGAPSKPAFGLGGNIESAGAPLLPALGRSGNIVPVLGKAVLAMAGAYLLRAIAESNASAQFPMLIAAVLYASGWMAWAVRAHRTNHFASAVYGSTATLILAPLLYEASTRFQLLPVTSSAAVLVGFVILVLVLAWHSNLEVLPWVATLASIFTLWALVLSTHELVPLTCALLAIAFATEVAACLGHRLSLWAMVAIAANAAVVLFIYVMTRPEGVPSSYTPASSTTTALLSLGLLAIYGGGIAIRSFGELKRISNFEVLQGAFVFAATYIGVTRASNGSAASLLGIVFIVLSLVCYWGVLSRFSGEHQDRNRAVSASWAVLLMIAGLAIAFPSPVGALSSCLLAIATLLVYRRNAGTSLALHTSIYLSASAILSPFLGYGSEALAGTVPGVPNWAVWCVLASALCCCGISPRPADKRWAPRLLWITPATLASLGAAALAVVAICRLISLRFQLAASRIAGIRTFVTCLLVLALGFLASRYRRPELGWLAYAALALGALKLLLEDLRFGNAASLVASLLFYGLILILLPRLLKVSAVEAQATKSGI